MEFDGCWWLGWGWGGGGIRGWRTGGGIRGVEGKRKGVGGETPKVEKERVSGAEGRGGDMKQVFGNGS